mmetsp:Transcript_6860/g.13501  ORF Transcript_6860/g.13501 Transcript_6860/m.13501 type:complete len:92 (-) Transcript_6860:393-668(-)
MRSIKKTEVFVTTQYRFRVYRSVSVCLGSDPFTRSRTDSFIAVQRKDKHTTCIFAFAKRNPHMHGHTYRKLHDSETSGRDPGCEPSKEKKW